MFNKLTAAALLATGAVTLAPAANAGLVSIGLQEGAGIITQKTGNGVAAISSVSFGTFTLNNVSATDTSKLGIPDLLFSNSLDASSSTAGTLEVWITSQNLTYPSALANVKSTFTSNTLPAGWTVTEKVFYDAGNGLYATTTPLGSATFTSNNTTSQTTPNSFAPPFSVTQEYIITATGTGTANDTIDTSILPEPASLALLGSALSGLGLAVRRRRRKSA